MVEIFLFGDFDHGLLRMSGVILQGMASAPGTADRCLNPKSNVKVPCKSSAGQHSSCGSQRTPGRTALPRGALCRAALFPLGLAPLALLHISLLGQDPHGSWGETPWQCRSQQHCGTRGSTSSQRLHSRPPQHRGMAGVSKMWGSRPFRQRLNWSPACQ